MLNSPLINGARGFVEGKRQVSRQFHEGNSSVSALQAFKLRKYSFIVFCPLFSSFFSQFFRTIDKYSINNVASYFFHYRFQLFYETICNTSLLFGQHTSISIRLSKFPRTTNKMRRYCRTVLFYRPLPTFSEIKSSFPFSMAIIFLIIRINKYLHYQVKWYQKWSLALHHVNANACITVFWYVITVRSHGRSSSRSSGVSLERNPR